jgi:ATP/maltotriose-dependent transcriptional regulator MalT
MAEQADLALAHAQTALARASEPRQPLALLAAHRVVGELDIDTGRYEDAAAHLDTSLALADACHAPYERALTLLAYAELRAATHEIAATQPLLDEARTICEPLGARHVLSRVDALVARLSTMPEAPAYYPGGLSAREVEVLRLIAAGLNNHEIAATLFISVRTVERHITNLYAKIGADGRADATAYALHHLT